jgi:hypothetical protein
MLLSNHHMLGGTKRETRLKSDSSPIRSAFGLKVTASNGKRPQPCIGREEILNEFTGLRL